MFLRSLCLPVYLLMLARPAQSQNLDSVRMVGAGTTSPAAIYAAWFREFEKTHPNIHFSYMPFGSGEGVHMVSSGKADFGGTDAPMTRAQLAKAGVRQFPTVLGAVVPIYDLAGVVHPLKFSPQVLAGIYLGTIKQWNDAAISRLNPGAELPASEIIVFHSTPGRGAAFVWSDFLSKTSVEWRRKVGAGTSVGWPTGRPAEGNGNLAQLVKQTPNSIGYVWLASALSSGLAYGQVQNAAGRFVTANSVSVAAAASTAAKTMPADFCVSITNPPGERAYPIASFIWLVVPENSGTAEKREAMRQFLSWVLTSGQAHVVPAGFAQLPAEVIAKELTALGKTE